jgi:hypothetical protein
MLAVTSKRVYDDFENHPKAQVQYGKLGDVLGLDYTLSSNDIVKIVIDFTLLTPQRR